MNVLEYVVKMEREDKRISRQSYIEKIFKIMGYEGKDSGIPNVAKAEMLSLLFGPISTRYIKLMDWPRMTDEYGSARLFSREISRGYFEKARLKKYDDDVRIMYVVTKKARERLSVVLKSKSVLKFNISPLRYHDYLIGYSMFMLFVHGYDISFEYEKLVSGRDEKAINYKNALRADALLTLNGKKYYIEQDVTTEKAAVLKEKLVKYGESDIPVIFSLHAACKFYEFNYDTACRVADVKIPDEDLFKYEKELRGVYLALSKRKDYSDALDILTRDKNEINRYVKLNKVYNLSLKRIRALFKCIIEDEALLDICTRRTEVYAITTELIHSCSAFMKKGPRQPYFGRLRNFYADSFVYDTNVMAYGVKFNECIKFSDHRVFILFAEDNVSDLLRLYKTYDIVNDTADRFVVLYHTETFLSLVKKIIGEKIFLDSVDFISI